MLTATEHLRQDHALTGAALAALRSIAAHVRAGGVFPTQDGLVLLRFLREFVVSVHFRKEAELLGPAAAMATDDRTAGLVGELMLLQDEAAELVHALVLFWEPEGDLTAAERAGFADSVDLLAQRLTRMQEIEEQDLFPACEAAIPLDDLIGWLSEFAQIERERCSRTDWTARITQLAKHWSA